MMTLRLLLGLASLVRILQLFYFISLEKNGGRERFSVVEDNATHVELRPEQPNHQDERSLAPQLQYFHIPKTGGVMMESLGGENNLSWGACNFLSAIPNPDWYNYEPWSKCPPLPTVTFPHKGLSYWHLPIYVLPHILRFDPYNLDPTVGPKKFFTVVRNPYDRLISAFYYYNSPDIYPKANDAQYMNNYILKEVRDNACKTVSTCYTESKCSGVFLCGTQHKYIYDGNRRVIDHVLHYETLQDDFATLAEQYSLNFSVPDKQPRHRKYKKRILTAANLTDETIRFINMVFEADFALGHGYEKRLPKEANSDNDSLVK